MRITFISYTFGEYCIVQANELASHAEVQLVMPRDVVETSGVEVDPRVQCVLFDRPRLRQPFRQMRSVRSLLSAVNHFKPDVVHYFHGHLWFNMALPLLRRFPLVVTIFDAQHHPGDAESKTTPQLVMNFGYRLADRLIVHSEHVRNSVVNDLGMPSEKIDVIRRVATGARQVAKRRAGAGFNILCFGRIWRYKGIEYLIKAQPLITERVPEAKFVIAGDGEDFDYYRRQMTDPSRFDVHHHWISDEQRTELFNEADVVALPYVEASQSGVIPVAYSFGKPVVVTNVGGLPEMVEHGRTGLIVPPRDVDSLADAIVSLLANPQLARDMGAAGRDKMNVEYSVAELAGRNLETYRRAVSRRQVRGRIREQTVRAEA